MKTPGLLCKLKAGYPTCPSSQQAWADCTGGGFPLNSLQMFLAAGWRRPPPGGVWWAVVSWCHQTCSLQLRAAEREEQKTDGRLTVRKRLACHFQLNTGCSLGSSLQPCLVTPSFLPGLCGMLSAHHISLGFSFKLKRKFERNNFEGTFGIHTHSTTAVCLQLLNLNWISLQFVEQLRNPCGHTYLP